MNYNEWNPEFADVLARIDEFGGKLPAADWPLLTEAVANGDLERVKSILQQQRDGDGAG